MDQSANVHSIDAIRDFRLALCKFREGASQSLAAVDIEIQRTLDWLGHDQLKYWKEEIRRREDRVNEAKVDLNRCMISKTATGETPSCSDQKVALAKAKARLVEAEEKVEKVRQWLQIIEQEVSEYKGPSQQLGNTVDATLPQALALLDRKVAMLEAYIDTAPPETESLAPSSSSADQPDPLPRKTAAPPVDASSASSPSPSP